MRKLRIGNKVLTRIDYEKLEREEKERARKKLEKDLLEKSIIDSYFRELSDYVNGGRYEFIRFDDPRLNHIPDNTPPVTHFSITPTELTDIYAVGTTSTYSPRLRKDVDED